MYKSFPFGITTPTTIVLSQNDIGCNGKNYIKSLKWCKNLLKYWIFCKFITKHHIIFVGKLI